jgi:hypothetical protein
MRAFFEVGGTAPVPPTETPAGSFTEAERLEIDLLRDQLGRMRAMLYKFTHLFFVSIHVWAVGAIALLVLGSTAEWAAAALFVPFVVPLAFLETGYLFYYTVFARRHAERLEQAIDERLGRDVLVAHRLEAAYFYPPERPKIAFLSFGNPLGFASAMTVGYSVAAALLWTAGVVLSHGFVAQSPPGGLIGVVVPAQVAWTAVVAAYLVWYFLARRDEDRLMRALAESYRVAAPTSATAADSPPGPPPEPGPARPPRSEPGPSSSPSPTVEPDPTGPSRT